MSADDDGIFHSDPHNALLVLHFIFPSRYREPETGYVFCISRTGLLAHIGLSFASTTVTSHPAVRTHTSYWEDWFLGQRRDL